jgi:ABC-type uncharacterized transport system permease subunit
VRSSASLLPVITAVLAFGRWRPMPVLAACLFFGFAETAADQLKLQWQMITDELARMLPFLLTLTILIVSKTASGMPAALGKRREESGFGLQRN